VYRRKQLSDITKNKDVRQKRIQEELERCKLAMDTLKANERESKDGTKKDLDHVLNANKSLEKQKSELVVALRKQMKLIDVLKRQNAHLEAAKLLSLTEQEFEKIIRLNKDE